MGSADRLGGQENKSIWNSRLFRIGLVFAAAGVFLGSTEAAAAGVVLVGASWAWARSNK